MKKFKATLVTLSLAAFAIACGQATTSQNTPTASPKDAPKASPAQPATPTAVAAVLDGKELYTINCMTCHKDSGKGGKITVEGRAINPDDITTAKMKAKPDEKFYGYIADGFPDDGMPAFKDKLKKEEIDAIIKHIRTLQGS
jgi:mono/diheme cytochrome c family protein